MKEHKNAARLMAALMTLTLLCATLFAVPAQAADESQAQAPQATPAASQYEEALVNAQDLLEQGAQALNGSEKAAKKSGFGVSKDPQTGISQIVMYVGNAEVPMGLFYDPAQEIFYGANNAGLLGIGFVSMVAQKIFYTPINPCSAISASASCMMQPRRLPACSTTPSALSLIMRAKIG